MKFTVEIEEFWLDEDSNGFEEELKASIRMGVIRQIEAHMYDKIQTEISGVVEKVIEDTLLENIQKEVERIISNGKIRESRYSNNEIGIEDWIRNKFTTESGYGSPEETIKKLAKNFGDEMKQRYDLLFASQIVAKLSDNGLLRDDAAKLLLSSNP